MRNGSPDRAGVGGSTGGGEKTIAGKINVGDRAARGHPIIFDQREMAASLADTWVQSQTARRFVVQPGKARVLPGHGNDGTGTDQQRQAFERRRNFYVGGRCELRAVVEVKPSLRPSREV